MEMNKKTANIIGVFVVVVFDLNLSLTNLEVPKKTLMSELLNLWRISEIQFAYIS